MEMYKKMNEIGENIVSLRTVYNIMESIQESYFALGADKELIMTGIEAVWYMTRRLGEDVGSCEEASGAECSVTLVPPVVGSEGHAAPLLVPQKSTATRILKNVRGLAKS